MDTIPLRHSTATVVELHVGTSHFASNASQMKGLQQCARPSSSSNLEAVSIASSRKPSITPIAAPTATERSLKPLPRLVESIQMPHLSSQAGVQMSASKLVKSQPEAGLPSIAANTAHKGARWHPQGVNKARAALQRSLSCRQSRPAERTPDAQTTPAIDIAAPPILQTAITPGRLGLPLVAASQPPAPVLAPECLMSKAEPLYYRGRSRPALRQVVVAEMPVTIEELAAVNAACVKKWSDAWVSLSFSGFIL